MSNPCHERRDLTSRTGFRFSFNQALPKKIPFEAEAAIERLAEARIERSAEADGGFAVREIWLLRLRALLARAHGDAASYADFRDRYRDMAKTLGFEGHIDWAEAMP